MIYCKLWNFTQFYSKRKSKSIFFMLYSNIFVQVCATAMIAETLGQIGSAGKPGKTLPRSFSLFSWCCCILPAFPRVAMQNLIHSSILYLSVCYLYSYIRALPRGGRGGGQSRRRKRALLSFMQMRRGNSCFESCAQITSAL